MAHAIIRSANGRRHEVDFEGAEIKVEIFFGDAARRGTRQGSAIRKQQR